SQAALRNSGGLKCARSADFQSFRELTESRGKNEDKVLDHAHHGHLSGGFSDVFVRVLSAENAGGGRDSLSNYPRFGIVHAALYQRVVWRRCINARVNPQYSRASLTHNKPGPNT